MDEQIRERARQKLEIEDRAMQWERYTAASYDDRIADYFLYGLGDEESLIAQLQRDYELSEQEVVEAIDKAIGQLQDVTDYGDEA